MPPRSDPRLLVLHGLRLKGLAAAPAIAEPAGLPITDVEACLEGLAAEGLVEQRGRPVSRWSLTAAGRAEHSRLVGREVDTAGVRPAIEGAYDRFRALNTGVLDACSRWQVRDIAGTAVRYRPYRRQLTRAVEKVEAGERDWFTKPVLPSYHTVWFELHEDLLTTLGLDRTAEADRPESEAGTAATKGVS
jgi:hypothetical protein